jgi:hypothetical protein
MLKIIGTYRQLTNALRLIIVILIFVMFFSKVHCQNNNNCNNSDFVLSQDTVGSEGLTELVLEHGFMKNNKKIGFWVSMFSNKCKFYGATIYTGHDYENDSTEIFFKVMPLLILEDYNCCNRKRLQVTDPDFNFYYNVSLDSIGRVTSKSYSNLDSTICIGYNENGTLKYYINSDNINAKIKNFDENGIYTSSDVLNADLFRIISIDSHSPISKGKLKNDLPHGIWKTYKNSKLVKIEKYKNGKLLYKTIFY